MKKKDIEKELKKMEAMTQEEFEEAYMKDAIIPTARNEAEARYIAEHSGADADSSSPNASRWFDNFIDKFCRQNGIKKESETKTVFQIVGWKDDVAYSAGITVYFKTKEIAEKFAELVKENVLCTIPTTNFDSEYGINQDDAKTVPKRIKDTPYFVRWYVDMREEEDNEQLHG